MNLITILGLAIIGLVLMALLGYLIRRPVAALWLVLAVLVLEALVDNELLSAEVAGFRVGPADVVYSLILGAALFRFLRQERTSTGQRALLVFGIAAAISLVDGVAGGSIERSVNEFRTYLGFIGAALYFSTARMDLETRIGMFRAWLAAGVALGMIVVLRWMARLGAVDLGIFDATDVNSGFDATVRVLNGPHALMLTTCALILLLPGIERGIRLYPRERAVGIVLLIMSIALNRRTLWVALVVVLAVLLVRNRKVGLRVAAGAFALLTLFVVALPLFQGTPQPSEEVAQSINDTDTLVWRFEGWMALLESGPSTPDEIVLGLPFGTGYSRYIDGVERVSGPHNFYLQTYLRTGLLGLGAFVTALVAAFMGLTSIIDGEDHPLAARHLMLLMIMLGIWMFAWLPLPDQGIIVGLAVATVAFRDQSAAPTGPVSRTPSLA